MKVVVTGGAGFVGSNLSRADLIALCVFCKSVSNPVLLVILSFTLANAFPS